MEVFALVIDFVLHIDRHLQVLCTQYGPWVYAILFIIVFCETGLVVTPILPGDSLLFAVGTMAAIGALDLTGVILVLIAAAIIGDSVNYAIGNYLGPKVFHQNHGRLLNKEYPMSITRCVNALIPRRPLSTACCSIRPRWTK